MERSASGRPRRRIQPFVDVTASGISSTNAVIPMVMSGRLTMSGEDELEGQALIEDDVDRAGETSRRRTRTDRASAGTE